MHRGWRLTAAIAIPPSVVDGAARRNDEDSPSDWIMQSGAAPSRRTIDAYDPIREAS